MQRIVRNSANTLIFYVQPSISNPEYLVICTSRSDGTTVTTHCLDQNSEDCNWIELSITDMGGGIKTSVYNQINIEPPVFWDISIYEQASGSLNTDPDAATLLVTEYLEVE